MSKSSLFHKAHALTKATIQAGDDYQAVFGACLKYIMAEAKQIKIEPAKHSIEWASIVSAAFDAAVILVMVAVTVALILSVGVGIGGVIGTVLQAIAGGAMVAGVIGSGIIFKDNLSLCH